MTDNALEKEAGLSIVCHQKQPWPWNSTILRPSSENGDYLHKVDDGKSVGDVGSRVSHHEVVPLGMFLGV